MSESDFALSVERHIAAPPAHVWAIITERLTEWWCPKPWTTEIVAIDWRAGGRWTANMNGPDGESSPVDGIFLEFTPGVRFVMTDAIDYQWNPKDPFIVGIFEIAPDGDGTRYIATARHWTEEAMARHRDMGFEQGWGAVADQLKALAEGPISCTLHA